jgi:hypothetical protein
MSPAYVRKSSVRSAGSQSYRLAARWLNALVDQVLPLLGECDRDGQGLAAPWQ